MACFIGILGRRLDARVIPQADLFQLTVRLLLISDGIVRSKTTSGLDGLHYLVAMGFEQSGALLARFLAEKRINENEDPLTNDHWYRLVLALLHYLAGGYRVQALSSLRQLEKIAKSITGDFNLYLSDYEVLEKFYRDTNRTNSVGRLEQWLLTDDIPTDTQGQHINLLAKQIRQRRDVLLSSLGRDSETEWLASRLVKPQAIDFWTRYLRRLQERGITTFTNEQAGEKNNFEWLRGTNNLLVILPTGSGKTIIGELRTALALAENKQVVWLLPTRALVRQTTLSIRAAFQSLHVTVEELPTTEDPIPLFDEELAGQKHVAITTPERFNALLRANSEAISKVGLVIVDEAQILEKTRGTTTEFVLKKVQNLLPDCNFVLMTAFQELKYSMLAFLTALTSKEPTELTSDNRLTRKIYGTLTNIRPANDKRDHPAMLLFPPGLQAPEGKTKSPYWLLSKQTLPTGAGPTEIAQRFTRDLANSNLRSVIFVNTVGSTETQAHRIAMRQEQDVDLPLVDVMRIKLELGRDSVVMETGKKGVVPHHGRMTKLEQITAEKWVRNDVVKTVVATPTLAEGVNLPFDFSIVTYTHRRENNHQKPLPAREIMNMIGRAGRAGYVSDGIGLIVNTNSSTPQETLDNSRRYFFHHITQAQEKIGFAKFLGDCVKAKIDKPDYPLELGSLEFSQIQILQSLILDNLPIENTEEDQIFAQIRSYPSVRSMSESELQDAATVLRSFGQNVTNLMKSMDPLLPNMVQRTGLPLEILQLFLEKFRTIDLAEMAIRGEYGQMIWADQLVQQALKSCVYRAWYGKLFGTDFDLERMFQTISSWREGSPIASLERIWHSDQSERDLRLKVGEFINHKLSLYTQLWGALAVCYELLYGDIKQNEFGRLLRALPAFTRTGVSSTLQLHWLYALGGFDRVLAHEVAQIWQSLGREQESIPYLRDQLRRWRLEQQPWPSQVSLEYRAAINAIIRELKY
ncbi:MAG: DEAD/DEAH box helicase [Chloroflexi bacterium]|nr:DEAD/DEAH box helicase [Chloroflexota bacterium]